VASDGVDSITSFSRPNSFTIVVNLETDQTSLAGVDIINAAIASTDLPAEAQVEAQAVNASKFLEEYDLLVGVVGPADATAAELEAAAETAVAPFGDQADIARADVVGLLTTGLDPATGEEIERESDFNQLTVMTANGLEVRPSIAIGVVAAANVDSLAVRDASDAALDDASPLLPAEYEATVAIDQATLIRQQIGSLQRNVITGILAVAVVTLFLISWRASVITALFIITVIATTMGVLYLVGISLNTISLFGVILALGLFVDDAIVITEAIDAFREDSSDPLAIIGHAIRRVGAASISGTVTTVLVFAPMLAISGILGDFIKILPISVIIALISSLVLSLVFIPLAARFLILPAPAGGGPLTKIQERLARGLASLPGMTGVKGAIAAVFGIGLSFVMTGVGLLVFAPEVGVNIFPPQKDSLELAVTYDFPPGTSINDAQAISQRVNQQAAEILGEDVERVYTYIGSEVSAFGQIVLTPLGTRNVAPDLVRNKLEPLAESVTDADVVFSQVSAGPPEALFPFQTQLFGEDPAVLLAAAEEIAAELDGAVIERTNGSTFNVLETQIAFTDSVARMDGERMLEIRARFDADDTTTTTAQTQEYVEGIFDDSRLQGLGLAGDALRFDFGLESQNQESFASLPRAFGMALLAMLVLLIFQFRSSLQWLLVFLAIPFSFFGVFGGLLITNNEISFFVMLGLLGLIGIAVNNSILLTDFANQERRAGADRKTAIQTALRRRFRPLVATSLTTVAGVLPLALSDPFWEALGFTIIFGLLSSTFLVLVSFPFYYLGIEWLRDKIKTPWRRFAM
jgi:multidrug efflux pump subunit AcrB